jgi:plastocyanin
MVLRFVVALVAATLTATCGAFDMGKKGAVITSIEPKTGGTTTGSLAGGTLLTIHGSGFQRGGVVGSTDVYVGALRCDIIDYYSDDTKLVCRTRQLHWKSAKDLEIKVAMWSYTWTSYAVCADPDGCTFHYDGDRNTPMITGAVSAAVPGGQLKFEGYLRGPEAVQYKITIDGKDCELRDVYQYSYTDDQGAPAGRGARDAGMSKQQQLEDLFGAPVDGHVPEEAFDAAQGSADVDERRVLNRYTDHITEWCTLPADLEAGRYNYTIHVSPGTDNAGGSFGYGNAQFRERGRHQEQWDARDLATPFNGSAYLVTVVPTIKTISTKKSGSNGGQTVVITGTGFHADLTDCSANAIFLAGAECVVQAPCTNTEITCVAPAATEAVAAAPYPGTSGLMGKLWQGHVAEFETYKTREDYVRPASTYSTLGGVQAYNQFRRNARDHFRTEESGYFVAPKTTEYRFWCYGDERIAVFFNKDGADPAKMKKIAYNTRPTHNYFMEPKNQISQKMALVKGERYAIAIYHTDAGHIEDKMVSVEILDADAHEDMVQYQRINEVQKLHFEAKANRQQQSIIITKTSGGSFKIAGKVVKGKATYSDPIDLNSKDPAGQLSAALRSAYRYNGGRGCNSYTVAMLEQMATRGTVRFDYTINCLPAVDASGSVQLFPAPEIDGKALATAKTFHDSGARAHPETNMGFDSDPPTGAWEAKVPAGWTSTTEGKVNVITNGNADWGSFNSKSGKYFAGLRKSGKVSHKLTGLTPGVEYSLGWLGALRPGRGRNAKMKVAVDGKVLYEEIPSAGGFRRYHGTFKAPNQPSWLTFENVEGDNEVFLDDVRVVAATFADKSEKLNIDIQSASKEPSTPLNGNVQLVVDDCSGSECVKKGTTEFSFREHPHWVKNRLEALPGIEEVTVTEKHWVDEVQSREYKTFQITFVRPHGIDHPLLQLVDKGLGGDQKSMRVSPVYEGNPTAQFHSPIPDSMLEIAPATSSATVSVNGINAQCVDAESSSCRFEYDAAATAIVSHVAAGDVWDPSQNVTDSTVLPQGDPDVTVGGLLNVFGSGFEAGEVSVTFGEAACDVVVSTENYIQCQVNHGTYGSWMPVVTTELTGVATNAKSVKSVKYGYAVESVSPLASGFRGGAVITLTGTGFSPNMAANEIMIGANACEVVAASHSTVECIVPAQSEVSALNKIAHKGAQGATAEAAVSVGLFDSFAFDEQFVYKWSETPSIVSMTPTFASAAKTTKVSLTLTQKLGYQAEPVAGCVPKMELVSPISGTVRACSNLQATGTGYECILVRSHALPIEEQDQMLPRLQVCASNGQMVIAHPEPAFAVFDLALRVTSTSPSVGSVAGGATITITGAGFVDESEKIVRSALSYNYLDAMVAVNVSLADREVTCQIIESSFNKIECVTVMPTARTAMMTSAEVHRYNGGYNGNIVVSINDHAAVGCDIDPDAAKASTRTTHTYSAGSRDRFVCEFDYATASSPKITGVSPKVGNGATSITIQGSKFGNSPKVLVGATECIVSKAAAGSIECDLPAMAGGRYNIQVDVPGSGFAAHPNNAAEAVSFVSQVVFSKTAPRETSLRGGLIVTVSGFGFSETTSNNKVTVGGKSAHVIHSTATEIVMVTPPTTHDPAPCGVPEPCGSEQHYVQFKIANEHCSSSGTPTCAQVATDESGNYTGGVFTQTCDVNVEHQLFRMELLPEVRAKSHADSVFRLRPQYDDSLCLTHQTDSISGQCGAYTFSVCSNMPTQQFHLSRAGDDVFSFSGGGDTRTMAAASCDAGSAVSNCPNYDMGSGEVSRWKLIVSNIATGKLNPTPASQTAAVVLTIEADAQPEYFYGQTSPVHREIAPIGSECGDFGGNFELIFREDLSHLVGETFSRDDWLSQNQVNKSAAAFSTLDQLEQYRRADGTFEFKLVYPDQGELNYQQWVQKSNPVTSNSVDGFASVDINFADAEFDGLALGPATSTSLLASKAGLSVVGAAYASAIQSNSDFAGAQSTVNRVKAVELYACSEGDMKVAEGAKRKIAWNSDTSRDDASVTIEVGSEVIWEFDLDTAEGHSIESGIPGKPDDRWSSGLIEAAKGTWSYQFNQTGEFRYFSNPYGYISGTISVVDSVIESPAAYRLRSDVHCSSQGGCDIVYSTHATPIITHVNPPSGKSGTRVTISGTNLKATDDGSTEVLIGAAECEVDFSSITDTELECVAGNSPAGVHNVFVTTSGFGTALRPGGTVYNMPEDSRSYSSVFEDKEEYSKSMLNSDFGWRPADDEVGEWMQIDLGQAKLIGGVATQPQYKSRTGARVTECEISTSKDGKEWINQGTLEDDSMSGAPFRYTFNRVVSARFVKFSVKAWQGSFVAMRAAVTGPNQVFESKMEISDISPKSGSFGGGTTVTLSGQGFGSSVTSGRRTRRDGAWGGWMIYDSDQEDLDAELGTKVTFCNAECIVKESSYDSITCVTEPLDSVEALTTYSHLEPAKLEIANTYSSNTLELRDTSSRAFDSDFASYFEAEAGSWWQGKFSDVTSTMMSDNDGSIQLGQGTNGKWAGHIDLPRDSRWRFEAEFDANGHASADLLEEWVIMLNGEVVGEFLNRVPKSQLDKNDVAFEFEGNAADVSIIAKSHKVDAALHGKVLPGRFVDIGVEPRTPTCFVAADLGEDARALVTRARFFPAHQLSNEVIGGRFESSEDGDAWIVLAHIDAAHQGWNWVDIGVERQPTARFYRYVGPSSSDCQMTQLEFYGHQVSATSSCAVEVSTTAPLSHPSLGPMQTLHSVVSSKTAKKLAFKYSKDATGIIESISPKWGSSLGGTKVTINGKNLGTSIAAAKVTINSKSCLVQSVAGDGSSIVCITTARGPRKEMAARTLTVDNIAAGKGVAITMPGVEYSYLDRWSEVNTWLNDEPPIEGDSVVIPEDQMILMDVSPPRLFWLQVFGKLVFDRKDLNLDATYILIYGGTFEVGTEDDPFMQQATITLHGDRRVMVELPFVGGKVLAVADKGGFTTHGKGRGVDVPISQKGVLDIHGIPRKRTWTKVEETVSQGTTTIITSEVTDFAAGEKIVLTAPHEELTVAERIDDYTFTVVEPTKYTHVSETREHEGFDTMDMRCEVALLSRNIIIQGAGAPRGDGSLTIAEDDDEKASVEQLFGVHTGAFHGGHYRVENTELRHCGQAGNLGRYCMHFHVNDNNPAPFSYIKSNSIHHSFQRATTVHGTHHALVQNNVAYHVMGHTYFVEDGDETYNTFDGNIGIFTKPHHMMLKSDKNPSTFWTAIPTNYWRNNIATDCTDRGAWFELEDQGITLEFFNNSFHHNGGIGFRNYPNYSPPSPQYFLNNTYFKNGGNGLFYKKGGDNHHVHSKFAENGVDLFWKKYKTHDESRLIPNVKDCLFYGGRGSQAIFSPGAEFWYVNGSTFVDYEDAGVLSSCAGCCSPISPKQGGYTVRYERLKFENSPMKTKWTCPYKQIHYDLDGTLTGHAGGTALPYYKYNEWEGHCKKDELDGVEGNYSAGYPGMVCNENVRVRRLQIWDEQPRELADKKIFFKKSEVVPAADMDDKSMKVDRFGNGDKFGSIDWNQYHETGHLYEGCLDNGWKPLKGYCLGLNNRDQNSGVFAHANKTVGDSECLTWCRAYEGATGCEQGPHGCFVHTAPINKASGNGGHSCWLFPQAALGKSTLSFSGCSALDSLDSINYRAGPGISGGEYSGWAVPMVTHHDYYADIDWHIDFQKLSMRWSEPFYFNEPYNKPLENEESSLLRFPYVDYRYRYRTSYAGVEGLETEWYSKQSEGFAESEPKQLDRFDAFGSSLILREDESLRTSECCGEWKVSMNPWSGADYKQQDEKHSLLFGTEALQCGPAMCGLPGDNSLCMQSDGVSWDEQKCPPLKWSDRETWTKLLAAEINTIDIEHTGLPPVDGDSIEIPRNHYVIFDSPDIIKLDKLVVTGRLVFDGQRRRLDADRILVWGSFEVGSAAKPYSANAEIVLHGVRTSPTLVATDQHFVGNKNLVVFGDLKLHGGKKATPWTNLTVTAKAGATELTVDKVGNWKVGDEFVVTGTEFPQAHGFEDLGKGAYLEGYTPFEAEVRKITAIEGNTVKFAEPLEASHFAETITASRAPLTTIKLNAHVAVLSRNVVVRGDLTDSPVEGEANWYTGYGGHIVVGEVNYGNYTDAQIKAMKEAGETLGITRKLGSLHASGVEFRDMGKLASEHPAVMFRYFSDLRVEEYPKNKIDNCAFADSWNYVVKADKSFGVEVANNVMHRSFRSAIYIDLLSNDTVLRNNLVINVHRSPDQYDPACVHDKSCYPNPFAAFMIWNDNFAEVSGNVAAGSDDIAFQMYPVDSCGSAEPRFFNNEAYGALVGLFGMDVNVKGDVCRSVTGFKAWKNAHLGIVTADQSANLALSNIVLSDNHIGVSLNFVRMNSESYGYESSATIADSVILGSTSASAECSASSVCRAVKRGDERGLKCNSDLGEGWRRVGILMPQWTNLKKTCEGQHGKGSSKCLKPNRPFRVCNVPWETRFGNVDIQHAKFSVSRTTFGHWQSNDCGQQSRAIMKNPSQPDFSAATEFSQLTWDATTVDPTAKVQLSDVTGQHPEASSCASSSCDAVNYFTIHDVDGSTIANVWDRDEITPGETFTMISAFNPALARADKCINDANTKSIVCRDYSMSRLVIESDPPRFVKRRLGPATITKYSDTPKYEAADDRVSFSVGPFAQGCSCQKHFAQFMFEVESGLEYEVATSGVLQDNNRISFFPRDPNECIVANVFFSKPFQVKVYPALANGGYGKVIPSTNGVRPTIEDQSGTNLMSPQERMLYITLCGGSSNGFWIDYGSLVQVTAEIQMTVDEFFATEETESRTKGTDAFITNVALLLNIPQSQIKVACVHAVGEPCIPDGARRNRREVQGQGSKTAVEFEISAPKVGEDGYSLGTDDTQEYLSDIVQTIQSSEGEFAEELARRGYPGVEFAVSYDDLVAEEAERSGKGSLAVGMVFLVAIIGAAGYFGVKRHRVAQRNAHFKKHASTMPGGRTFDHSVAEEELGMAAMAPVPAPRPRAAPRPAPRPAPRGPTAEELAAAKEATEAEEQEKREMEAKLAELKAQLAAKKAAKAARLAAESAAEEAEAAIAAEEAAAQAEEKARLEKMQDELKAAAEKEKAEMQAKLEELKIKMAEKKAVKAAKAAAAKLAAEQAKVAKEAEEKAKMDKLKAQLQEMEDKKAAKVAARKAKADADAAAAAKRASEEKAWAEQDAAWAAQVEQANAAAAVAAAEEAAKKAAAEEPKGFGGRFRASLRKSVKRGTSRRGSKEKPVVVNPRWEEPAPSAFVPVEEPQYDPTQIDLMVDKLFVLMRGKVDVDGCLSGKHLVVVTKKCNPTVPEATLKQIWAACDTKKLGKLDKRQCVKMLAFIGQVQHGMTPNPNDYLDAPAPGIEGLPIPEAAPQLLAYVGKRLDGLTNMSNESML